MKVLLGDIIIKEVENLFIKLNLAPDSLSAVTFKEPDMSGIEAFYASMLDENKIIAAQEFRPLCQDTGIAQLFVKIGSFCKFSGAYTIDELLNEGVRRAYKSGKFRKSIVKNPFERVNTGDNTPAVIHVEEVDGNGLTIYGMVKGGGSENVSSLKMLPPSAGKAGVADFVIDSLKNAGDRGCPPYFLGLGVGGTFDTVALMAKKALLEECVEDAELAAMINERLNELDYGILGFSGRNGVKKIYIKVAPTHIATLPAALSINCHSLRIGKIEL